MITFYSEEDRIKKVQEAKKVLRHDRELLRIDLAESKKYTKYLEQKLKTLQREKAELQRKYENIRGPNPDTTDYQPGDIVPVPYVNERSLPMYTSSDTCVGINCAELVSIKQTNVPGLEIHYVRVLEETWL